MSNIQLIDEIQSFVEKITDSKACYDGTDNAILDAESAWDKYGVTDIQKYNQEENFWLSLLAYRYSHLLMRKKSEFKTLEKCDSLLKFISDQIKITHEFNYFHNLSLIYRISVIHRIKKLSNDQSGLYDKQIQTIWNQLNGIKNEFGPDVIRREDFRGFPINSIFHNLLELTCYYNELDYRSLEGANTYLGITLPINMGKKKYRIIHSKKNYSEKLYPLTIARDIALNEPDSIVFQIDLQENRDYFWFEEYLDGKFNKVRATANTLELLVCIMSNPEFVESPAEQIRVYKSRLVGQLTPLTGLQHPIEHKRGSYMKLSDEIAVNIIGIVEQATYEKCHNFEKLNEIYQS